MNLKLLDHFHHKKRENHLLCIVIALAVTLHFLAIYLLHGMHIHGEMFTARPISQQNSFPFSSHNSEDKRIEREIRNQQLANAFEKSKIQPPQQPEFSHLTFDAETLPPSIQEQNLSNTLAYLDESVDEQPLFTSALNIASTTTLSIDQPLPFNNETLHATSMAPLPRLSQNNELIAALMSATDSATNTANENAESLFSTEEDKLGAHSTAINSEPYATDLSQAFLATLNQPEPFPEELESLISPNLTIGLGGDFEKNLSTALKTTSNDCLANVAYLIPHGGGGGLGLADHDSNFEGSIDGFNVSVEYEKKQDESGYLFRLQLMPKEEIAFKRISQNVSFVIDRSGSIGLKRYKLSKAAVVKALTHLKEGDSFNLIIFDQQITRLSSDNLPWNSQSLAYASEWLSKQGYGGNKALTSLYSSLNRIIPSTVPDNEVNTFILLSDGDDSFYIKKQRDQIGKWTTQNDGKVSLYSVIVGDEDKSAMLDLLSTLNKGSLHQASTENGLESTLLSLVDAIQHPIGKEMAVTAFSADKEVNIQLYPSANRLPNLYKNQPYLIYGTIDRLEDFSVFFQGKYYGKLLDIKQTVSFHKATQSSDLFLAKMWALQQAYELYLKYLENKEDSYLTQIKNLLEPFKIPLAF